MNYAIHVHESIPGSTTRKHIGYVATSGQFQRHGTGKLPAFRFPKSSDAMDYILANDLTREFGGNILIEPFPENGYESQIANEFLKTSHLDNKNFI